MASLTGNQINNTYQGLLKTDNNAAITGEIAITDGAGNAAGLSLNPANSEFLLTGNGTQNPRFTLTNSAVNPTYIPFQAEDGVGGIKAQLNFDQYGSYNMISNVSTADPELIVQNLADSNAKIAINAWNSTNNSDNWFTAYNERITAGSYDGGTQNLTLTKPDGSDIVVNIPSGGGGGTPGMVAGTGTNSVKSADFLMQTGFPAIASGADALALMSNAQATQTHSIAIGLSARAAGTSSVAMGPGAIANASDALAFGRSSQALGSDSLSIGQNARSNYAEALAFGTNNTSDYFTSITIGNNQYNKADGGVVMGTNNNINNSSYNPQNVFIIGQGNVQDSSGAPNLSLASNHVIIGGSNSNLSQRGKNVVIGFSNTIPNSHNESFMAIGNSITATGTNYNTTLIGLIANTTNSQDSVGIGRNATLTNANNAVVVGRDATASASGATALGYQAVAANSGWTATKKLELNDYATLNFADDTAAAAGGVPLGGIYHNAGALRIRIV